MSEWCDELSSISLWPQKAQDCTLLDSYLWWVGGKSNDKLRKSNPDTGAVINIYDLPGGYPRGLTNDGTYLWFTDNLNKKIYKIDPADGSEILNKTHGVAAQIGGLTYLGGYLYLVRRTDEKCYKIDPSDGSIVSSFAMTPCGGNQWGLGNDGEYLWNTINDGVGHGREIEQLSITGDIIQTCSPSNWGVPSIRGICFDGSNLRVCATNYTIYKLGEIPAEEEIIKKWALHRVGIRFVRL